MPFARAAEVRFSGVDAQVGIYRAVGVPGPVADQEVAFGIHSVHGRPLRVPRLQGLQELPEAVLPGPDAGASDNAAAKAAVANEAVN